MNRYPNTLAQFTYSAGAVLLCVCLNAHMATESHAQVNQASYQTPAAAYFSSGQGYYRQARAPQQAVQTQVVQLNGNKPFQNIQRGPTVSPYLSLDMPETSTSLPNYYAYVRPQLQQRETNAAQAEEIQRLRQQVRISGGHGKISKNLNEGLPTTGSSSQFMNLGSYFPASVR